MTKSSKGMWLSASALFLAVGTAEAQDDFGGEANTQPSAADIAMGGGAYPAEEVARPLNLQPGMLEVGSDLNVFKAPDLGDLVGFTLRADYGATDKLQVGLRLPLALATPGNLESLGGVWVNGLYALHEMVSLRLDVGYGHAGLPAGLVTSVAPTFFDLEGMTLGFRLGAAFKHRFNEQLAVTADPGLVFQLDGAFGDSGAETFQALWVPLALWYQATSNVAVAVNTGILSAHEFKFSGDDGAQLPLFLTGQFTTLEGHLDVGANLGLANLTTGEGQDVGDTLFLGVFGTYRL